MRLRIAICVAWLFVVTSAIRADQLEMQNGDRYVGKVLSMTADSVVLQSEMLGKITVPRAKVANINLGATITPVLHAPAATSTNHPKTASLTMTNNNAEMAEALRHLGANTNFIEQVRKQFLSDAGPDANHKFDDMVSGLASGRLDLASIRAEAKSAADQIRTLKQQGGDVGDILDSYLTILDNFVKESAPAAPVGPPAPKTPVTASK